MRHARLIVPVVALLAAVACTPGASDEEVARLEARIAAQQEEIAEQEATIEELRAAAENGAAPPAPFTPAALTDQLHAYFLDDLPEEFEPGTTPWRDEAVPAAFTDGGDRFDAPGALMVALAERLGAAEGLGTESWEVALRVLSPEGGRRARGALLLWGFRDDSVAGTDLRVQLRRDSSGWYVRSAETRERCWRGVSDELCV